MLHIPYFGVREEPLLSMVEQKRLPPVSRISAIIHKDNHLSNVESAIMKSLISAVEFCFFRQQTTESREGNKRFIRVAFNGITCISNVYHSSQKHVNMTLVHVLLISQYEARQIG